MRYPGRNELTLSGHFLIGPMPGSDGQALPRSGEVPRDDRGDGSEDDRWFVVRRAGTNKEVQATHVEGDIWAFHFQETGVPFKLIVTGAAGGASMTEGS